jgi:hypothetical protein
MASINPAFQRHHLEAALIGRIVVHFGELEVSFCQNNSLALDTHIPLMKALYSLKATSSRIDFVDGLIRNLYLGHNLGAEYDICISMLRYCLRIRNLFAHCNWADSPGGGGELFYADLQVSAKTADLTHGWKQVDVALLQQQEDYFAETMEWLTFLHHELMVRQGKLQFHVWPRPSKLAQPPLHNPASQHIPPWLDEDQKAQHLARAQAEEAPPRQPERPPSILRLTREEWAARDAKEAREAAARAIQKALVEPSEEERSEPPQEKQG